MTLQEIYDLALEMGIKADPRGEAKVQKLLAKRRQESKELSEKKRKYFDSESLNNPYSDSRILYGEGKTSVKTLMAGIDADASEILIADRLSEKGKKVDLVIGHHPSGHALASLYEVMDLQIDTFADAGVPINVAHALMHEKMSYVQRRFSPLNHAQSVDAAKLLDVPLLALHTIWDNMGDKFLKDYLKGKEFDTVGEVLEYIKEIPEFVESTRGKSGPFIAVGSEKGRAGKVISAFTGGTNASKEMYMELAKVGVGTIVEMHVPEEAVIELRKLHINVIDCGHMAADSIGANLFLDELEKRGIDVIPCSGLIRVKRK